MRTSRARSSTLWRVTPARMVPARASRVSERGLDGGKAGSMLTVERRSDELVLAAFVLPVHKEVHGADLCHLVVLAKEPEHLLAALCWNKPIRSNHVFSAHVLSLLSPLHLSLASYCQQTQTCRIALWLDRWRVVAATLGVARASWPCTCVLGVCEQAHRLEASRVVCTAWAGRGIGYVISGDCIMQANLVMTKRRED